MPGIRYIECPACGSTGKITIYLEGFWGKTVEQVACNFCIKKLVVSDDQETLKMIRDALRGKFAIDIVDQIPF